MAGRNSWWKNGAIVIGMYHDNLAEQTSAHTPTGCPTELLGAVPGKKPVVGSFGKVLAEEMGGTRLYSFAILHHCLDAKSGNRTGKPFTLGLFAFVIGNLQQISSTFLLTSHPPQAPAFLFTS